MYQSFTFMHFIILYLTVHRTSLISHETYRVIFHKNWSALNAFQANLFPFELIRSAFYPKLQYVFLFIYFYIFVFLKALNIYTCIKKTNTKLNRVINIFIIFMHIQISAFYLLDKRPQILFFISHRPGENRLVGTRRGNDLWGSVDFKQFR